MSESVAYWVGYHVFMSAWPMPKCPYRNAELISDWQRGWHDAHTQSEMGIPNPWRNTLR